MTRIIIDTDSWKGQKTGWQDVRQVYAQLMMHHVYAWHNTMTTTSDRPLSKTAAHSRDWSAWEVLT